MESAFIEVYNSNLWDSKYKSGAGAADEQTKIIRKEIPQLIKNFKINSFFDCPCGDLNFMKQILHNIPNYTGADIVPDLINLHKQTYQNHNFILINITVDPIPMSDIIFCRDLLVHFNFNEIFQAIKNIKASNSKLLLTTTFTNRTGNADLRQTAYEWRPINLEKAPFNFPKPVLIINEGCAESNNMFMDKSLGLWEIKSLPDF